MAVAAAAHEAVKVVAVRGVVFRTGVRRGTGAAGTDVLMAGRVVMVHELKRCRGV